MSDLLSPTDKPKTYMRADESDPVLARFVSSERHKNHIEGYIRQCLYALGNSASYKQIDVPAEGKAEKVWVSSCTLPVRNKIELQHTCEVMNQVINDINQEHAKTSPTPQTITFAFAYRGDNNIEFMMGFPDAYSPEDALEHASKYQYRLSARARNAIFGDVARSIQ